MKVFIKYSKKTFLSSSNKRFCFTNAGFNKKMNKNKLIHDFLEGVFRGDVELISSHISKVHSILGNLDFQHPTTGNTALITAAERNLIEVVEFLLEKGADITLCNYCNQTAVHVANDAVRRQLLLAINGTRASHLRLLQISWQGDLQQLQHMLASEKSLDINFPNQHGLTPLMLAVRDVDLFESLDMLTEYRPIEILSELLKHNADPKLCDVNGKSAIHYVSQIKSSKKQQLLDLLMNSLPKPERHPESLVDICYDADSSESEMLMTAKSQNIILQSISSCEYRNPLSIKADFSLLIDDLYIDSLVLAKSIHHLEMNQLLMSLLKLDWFGLEMKDVFFICGLMYLKHFQFSTIKVKTKEGNIHKSCPSKLLNETSKP